MRPNLLEAQSFSVFATNLRNLRIPKRACLH